MMSLFPEHHVSPPIAPPLTSAFSGHERAIAVAIRLLKQQNPKTVQTLKNLLTFIPNPNHAKEVLTAAVIGLVHTCPKSALWLFRHPEVLEPEIQTRDIIKQELTSKVLSWGYTCDDFHFTANHDLKVTDEIRQSLLSSQPIPSDQAAFALIRVLLAIAAIAPDD